MDRLLFVHSYSNQPLTFVFGDVFAGIIVYLELSLVLSADFRGKIEERIFKIEVIDGISPGANFLSNGPFGNNLLMLSLADHRFVTNRIVKRRRIEFAWIVREYERVFICLVLEEIKDSFFF